MQESEIIEKVSGDTYFVKLLKEYYEKEAVFAAADMFLDKFHIKIDSLDLHVGIWFSIKPNTCCEYDTRQALLDFCNEAINQQTYRDLDRQFGSLREKIYKYAFEPIENQQ